jgi:hypothetical protein
MDSEIKEENRDELRQIFFSGEEQSNMKTIFVGGNRKVQKAIQKQSG